MSSTVQTWQRQRRSLRPMTLHRLQSAVSSQLPQLFFHQSAQGGVACAGPPDEEPPLDCPSPAFRPELSRSLGEDQCGRLCLQRRYDTRMRTAFAGPPGEAQLPGWITPSSRCSAVRLRRPACESDELQLTLRVPPVLCFRWRMNYCPSISFYCHSRLAAAHLGSSTESRLLFGRTIAPSILSRTVSVATDEKDCLARWAVAGTPAIHGSTKASRTAVTRTL